MGCWVARLVAKLVALSGRSLAISDTPTYKFGGLFLYALFTELFQKDISYAHSTYNCMIPHLYSDKPLLRRNTSHTVTWADWSPLVTGVTVLDRFSQPDVITVKDVCGEFFVSITLSLLHCQNYFADVLQCI